MALEATAVWTLSADACSHDLVALTQPCQQQQLGRSLLQQHTTGSAEQHNHMTCRLLQACSMLSFLEPMRSGLLLEGSWGTGHPHAGHVMVVCSSVRSGMNANVLQQHLQGKATR